jgi:uncharacterized membrane protein YczE
MIYLKNIKNKNILIYRILFAIIGISIMSMGISFMRYAVFGVDPMTCLNTGIAKQIGISFGTWQLIMFSIMLIGVFIFDRSKIGFGTVYIMVAVGYTSDIFFFLFTQIQFMEIFSIEIRIIGFIIGTILCYFGAAVYIETNVGLSPYDAVAIIISEKIKKQNWFKWIRIGTDALCVFGGLLTKSDIGIGTLFAVLLGGPLISIFRKLILKINLLKLIQNKV